MLLVPATSTPEWVSACAEAVRDLGASVTADARAAVAQAGLAQPVWVCGPTDLRIETEPAGDWLQRRYPRLVVRTVPAGNGPELALALRQARDQAAWRWPRWWPWRERSPVPLAPIATSPVAEVRAADASASDAVLLLRALADQGPLAAAAYALTVAAEVERQYRAGVRLLAFGAAPNTPAGGWGVHWRSAPAHGAWWLTVVRRLRGWFPELRLGYPPLAGSARGDVQLSPEAWLDLSASALKAADWALVGAEWATPAGRWALSGGQLVKGYRRRFATLPLVLIGPEPAARLVEQAEGTVGVGAVVSLSF